MRRRLESGLREFFRVNRELSIAIGRLWPHTRYNPFRDYAAIVAAEMGRPDVKRMADIGAGLSVPYATLRLEDGVHLIGVDISEEDMASNTSLDEARVVNVVADPLPFEPNELDLIVSSSVLEHLQDLSAFVEQAARVLRPGGGFIHVFPSRYAPFAIINRVVPHRLKRSILHFAFPATVGTQGFPAYYDRTYHSAFAELLERNGFELELARASYYGSAPYFSIFAPAYAGVLLLELLMKATGRLDLCATLLVVARKRGAAGDETGHPVSPV
jgi:SAM-dependent methyltransferase